MAFDVSNSLDAYFRCRCFLFLSNVKMLEEKLLAVLPQILDDATELGDCNSYALELIAKLKTPETSLLIAENLYFS
jgi:hypothetical protein